MQSEVDRPWVESVEFMRVNFGGHDENHKENVSYGLFHQLNLYRTLNSIGESQSYFDRTSHVNHQKKEVPIFSKNARGDFPHQNHHHPTSTVPKRVGGGKSIHTLVLTPL